MRSFSWARATAVAVLFLSLGGISLPAAAAVSKVINFSDSLGDTGNLLALTGVVPQPSDYFEGRFSNGRVAVEYLTEGLGLAPGALENHAYGGANTGLASGPLPDLPVPTGIRAQVALYALGGQADANALYVLWGGPNDIRYLGANTLVADQAVQNLVDSLQQLYGLGARQFLLPNLPDIGLTPYARALDELQPGTRLGLSQLSAYFNGQLGAAYSNFSNSHADAALFNVDVFGAQQAVTANPAAFGFSNVSEACFQGFVGDHGPRCPDATGYFYWDEVHPTTQAHALLGGLMLAAVVPEPQSVLLMAGGLLLLLGHSRWRYAGRAGSGRGLRSGA